MTLKNVKLSAKQNEKNIFNSEIGEMTFMRNSITGPIVLTCSSFINRQDFSNIKLYIDFKPALSEESLENRIDRDIAELKSGNVSALLEGLLPKSLVSVFAERTGFKLTEKANQMNKEKRKRLINLLKNFELTPISLESFDSAIVTSGGINLKEINPKFMRSKNISNLYFIGEVLDIDALTGGFNIQLAFATAVTCASDFKDYR